MADYATKLRHLQTLLRANEAINEAMSQAAKDVLDAASERKKSSPGPHGTGRITPYRSADFEMFVRRVWQQARDAPARNEARKMLRDGTAHGLIDVGVGQELEKQFGNDE